MTCILLVEDDDDVRETLEGVLGARGLHVLAARNGRDALNQVRSHGTRPSVIVLDLMMPQMDGEEFLVAQMDEPLVAHVPVILATAQLCIPDPLPAVVKTVLSKPMQLGDLLLAIDRCVIDSPTAPPALAHGTGALPPVVEPTPPDPPSQVRSDLTPPRSGAYRRPSTEPPE